MNTNWIHIEFTFYGAHGEWWRKFHKILGTENHKRFRQLLRIIYTKLQEYTIKSFYLYEPDPHCFFAFELIDGKYLWIVNKIINDVRKIYLSRDEMGFIQGMRIKENTNDAENGTGFLTVLSAMTEYNLVHEDNSISHVIHCCMNNSGFPRIKENNFYKLMSKLYK